MAPRPISRHEGLDTVFTNSWSELVNALDQAFNESYAGFALRRDGEPEDIGKALRVPIKVQYQGKSWGTVPLEVSAPEGTSIPHESVTPIDLADFGLPGPASLPCLPIRRQIAQKLHAMTQAPPRGRDNPRFRDLLDLWQLKDRVPADPELRAECKQIFRLRATHPWPPNVIVYDSWVEPYRTVAKDAGASISDAQTAANDVREYIARIEALASRVFAWEFRAIPGALAENTDLRDAVYELVGQQPIAGKVTEEPERLARFRQIMERLVAGEIDVAEAIRRTDLYLSRPESSYRFNNGVFPLGWAERLVRTQFSRFYNQAVMELMLAEGSTGCFVPPSSEEDLMSPCSQHLAGREHDVETLYERLIKCYSAGEWSRELKIPEHPHCTHVIRPIDSTEHPSRG